MILVPYYKSMNLKLYRFNNKGTIFFVPLIMLFVPFNHAKSTVLSSEIMLFVPLIMLFVPFKL
jgi:hypothetical protein